MNGKLKISIQFPLYKHLLEKEKLCLQTLKENNDDIKLP